VYTSSYSCCHMNRMCYRDLSPNCFSFCCGLPESSQRDEPEAETREKKGLFLEAFRGGEQKITLPSLLEGRCLSSGFTPPRCSGRLPGAPPLALSPALLPCSSRLKGQEPERALMFNHQEAAGRIKSQVLKIQPPGRILWKYCRRVHQINMHKIYKYANWLGCW